MSRTVIGCATTLAEAQRQAARLAEIEREREILLRATEILRQVDSVLVAPEHGGVRCLAEHHAVLSGQVRKTADEWVAEWKDGEQ